ncbi:uncharacterized protein LOC143206891 [Rhynchophorus ferrugineus]|uniref:uncharacterized protein LOC143206891 n=1 Tax=Rhynchophorus ferrugineus TaxID=354439 RepID=UPI003FCD1577
MVQSVEDFVGATYIPNQFQKHFWLQSLTSIFVCGTTGYLLGSIYIEKVIDERTNTDSNRFKCSLECTRSAKSIHPLETHIRELHKTLQKKGVRIRYFWVPSHRGITGNEKVDFVASSIEEELNWDLLMKNNKLWEIKRVFHQLPDINNISRFKLTERQAHPTRLSEICSSEAATRDAEVIEATGPT